jgi:hypothetical protein
MERNVTANLAAILAAAAQNAEPKVKIKNPGTKPRGGNKYIIHDETKIREKLSKQAVFILTALMNAGVEGLTKKELAALAIADPVGFPTNQPHERAIGFYLSEFKSEGALAFASVLEDTVENLPSEEEAA